MLNPHDPPAEHNPHRSHNIVAYLAIKWNEKIVGAIDLDRLFGLLQNLDGQRWAVSHMNESARGESQSRLSASRRGRRAE